MPLVLMHFLITTAHENWTDIDAKINVLEKNSLLSEGQTVVPTNSIVPQSTVNKASKSNQSISAQRWRKYWVVTKAVMGIASLLWGFGLLLLLARQGQTGISRCEDNSACLTPLQPLISSQADHMQVSCTCLVIDLDCNKFKNSSVTLEEEILNFNPIYPISMDLTCNNVTRIPTALESFEKLVFLDLHEFHGITTLSFDFTTLSRLLVLRISKFSSLSQIPETLKNLPSTLRTIRLTDMEQLEVIPTWVSSQWKQLSRLYLERIGLVGFPSPILELDNLAILSLNGNPQVSVIPPEIKNFELLEILSLTNTNISSLPPAVWSFELLRSLSVGHNNIATLEDFGSVELSRIQNWESTYNSLITLTGNPLCQTYKEELSAHPDACATECSPMCTPRLELDYKCDEECNTESCEFDHGFCKV